MKKVILLIAFILFTFYSYSQDKGVTKIKIYLVKWNSRYHIVRTTENIKQLYLYYFETQDNDLTNMFIDYSDCVEKLNQQDTVYQKYNSCSVYVELYFNRKKLTVYFKNSGDYYFNAKWHKINYGLYYALFSLFSDELIPAEILNKAKLNMKNSLWNKN